MKATGIVRRVEEYGIIGQKSKKRISTKAFIFSRIIQFAKNDIRSVLLYKLELYNCRIYTEIIDLFFILLFL